ncbi:hypothetical protein As57867_016564, partial [Aphanomyces stellatus]
MKFALIALAASVAAAAKTKFSLDLNRAFEREAAGVEVHIKFNTDVAALNAAAAGAADPRQAVFDHLTKVTKASETLLRSVVGASATIESLWVAQSFLVKMDKDTAAAVAALDQVTYLDVNSKIDLVDFIQKPQEVASATPDKVEWGIDAIGAPSIWKYFKGKGVVVGSIDTGALATHEAIKANWRADKGWFDPYDQTATPYDSQGHGSHTIGTMVGANGIGVAPEAQWISCMGLKGKSGSTANLLKCAQFMLCPTKTDGTDADCKKGVDVVNNSWGRPTSVYDPYFETSIAAWKAANITPIFSNGNSGPVCKSTGIPGGYTTVISVGAIGSGENDPTALAYFSSKGSATSVDPLTGQTVTLVKPDVSAPGYWTRSVA